VTPLVTFAKLSDAPELRALMSQGLSPFDVETELARGYARLWVLRRDAAAPLAGFLLAWEVADEAHLIDVIVAPSERRQGFGRALVETLLNHARARKSRVVLLEVRRSNLAAQTLYTSLGFEEVGERTAYYADGEDALLLRLTLEAC
jgi:ribosomal-protein-alanine N-acetyltransferase